MDVAFLDGGFPENEAQICEGVVAHVPIETDNLPIFWDVLVSPFVVIDFVGGCRCQHEPVLEEDWLPLDCSTSLLFGITLFDCLSFGS